ncbi:MAG: multidrug ABC transporter permease [Bryobacterales bacterium]|nr:multidrug ABC transporter permease [Bryobacterales bacterium]
MSFWLPVIALWKRELVRFWRQKSRILGVVASPLVFWLLIGSGFGDMGLFFPGSLVLTVMFSAIFSTITIIEDRREGFLLSMLVSPASRTSMVLGKVLGSATLAWIQGMIFLAFAPLAGVKAGVAGLLGAAGSIFLIAFTLAALGFLIAWKMNSTQGFHAVMNLALLPMWMVSGAIFPVAKAQAWVKWVMLANPLTYSLALLRGQLTPEAAAGGPPAPVSIGLTVLFGVVLLVASAKLANRKSTASAA